MQHRFGTLLLVALVLLFSAAAQEPDNSTTFSTPACPVFSYILPLTNPSAVEHHFSVSFSDHSQYATIEPNDFVAAPTSTQNVTLTFSPPCDQAAMYTTTLTVAEGETIVSSIPFTFPVDVQRRFVLTLGQGVGLPGDAYSAFTEKSSPYTFCNGSSYAIPFRTTNFGSNDTFRFTMPAVDGIKIAAVQYKLQTGQTGVNAVIVNTTNVPQGLFFRVVAAASKLSLTVPIPVESLNCISASVEPPQTPPCGCSSSVYFLNLQSDQEENVTVTLSSNSSLIGFSSPEFTFSKETRVPITYTPSQCSKDEQFTEPIVISTSRMQQTVHLSGKTTAPSTCLRTTLSHPRAVYAQQNKDTSLQLRVNNLGTTTQSYSFSLDSPAWATLGEANATIRAGQSYSLPILVAPTNVSGWYRAVISASGAGNSTQTSAFLIYVSGNATYNAFWIAGIILAALLVVVILLHVKNKASTSTAKTLQSEPPKERKQEQKIILPKLKRETPKEPISKESAASAKYLNWSVIFWVCFALALALMSFNLYWSLTATLLVVGAGALGYGILREHAYAQASGILFLISGIILGLSRSIVSVAKVLTNYGLYLWIGLGGLFALLTLGHMLPRIKHFLLAEDLEIATRREEEERKMRK